MTRNPFDQNQKVRDLKDVLSGKKDESYSEGETLTNIEVSDDVAQKKIQELEEQLAKLREDLKEAQGEGLRARADFENSRRRLQKEQDDQIRFSNEKLIREFLPVLDSLEMSLAHVKPAEAKESLVEGVRLTLKQFMDLLEKSGVETVSGEGGAFDPNRQEAVGTEDSDTVPEGNVVSVHRKGYVLSGRLIRPAIVTVAKNSNKNSLH